MNKYDVTIGQIVLIEKTGSPYDGFYSKVLKKYGIHHDGIDMVVVELGLKCLDDGEMVTMPVKLDYEDVVDDDGYWDADDYIWRCPSIIDQFNQCEDVFAETVGALPLEEEIHHIFDNGDYCRALRYILDITDMMHKMGERICLESEMIYDHSGDNETKYCK